MCIAERSCQVYRNECLSDGTGTVYVTVGTAGANLEAGGFSDQLGNWSIAHTEQFGYTRVHANLETLTVQVCLIDFSCFIFTHIRLWMQFVLNTDGSVYDEAVLEPWPTSGEAR